MRRRLLPSVPTSLIAFVALLLAVGIAQAPTSNTIHVDCTNTTGIEDGSEAYPYDTIQEGIDAALDGDTVLVHPCTYYENIDFLRKAITVTSVDPLDPSVVAATVIDGGGAGSVVTFKAGEGAGSVLTGVTVRNGTGTPWSGTLTAGGAIYCDHSSPTIANNVITASSAYWGGGIVCMHSSAAISGNIVTGNTAGHMGGGLRWWGGSPTIAGNTISANRSGSWGGGLYCGSTPAVIANNVIVGNKSDGTGGGMHMTAEAAPYLINDLVANNRARYGGAISCDTSSPALTNCTIANNEATLGASIYCLSGDGPSFVTISNSIVLGDMLLHGGSTVTAGYSLLCTDDDAPWPGIGNLCADPQLDCRYHLLSTSPCIDAGTNVDAPADDIDGDARPWAGTGIADIGADEWLPLNLRPCCEIAYEPSLPAVGEPVSCDSQAYDPDGSVVSVSWAFGDGTEADGATTIHMYDTAAKYVVVCTVTDDEGGVSVCSTTVEVVAPVTVYVDSRCPCPTPDGTLVCPYCSIQEAINAAQNGDTVVVAPGTYVENLDFVGKAITVTSMDPLDPSVVAATTVDGGASDSVVTFAHDEGPASVLTGFTLTNGQAGQGGGIHCYYSSPTIRRNRIIGNYAQYGSGGGISCSSSSPSIVANLISDNTADSCGGGVCFSYSSPVLLNNIIVRNSARYGGGFYCNYSSPALINCTIADNTALHGDGSYRFDDSSPLARNCILWNREMWGVEDVAYSDLLEFRAGEGNISLSPRFVDDVNGDYHLCGSSPCVDSGAAAFAPPDDVDGQPRPWPSGGQVDMGADEYPIEMVIVTKPEGGEVWV